MTNQLETHLAQRILILDGAMATMIQQYELEEHDFRSPKLQSHPISVKGNNDLLNLTRPDIIQEIHAQYLKAGADVICTNTFNANSISQADYQTQDMVDELNYHGVKLARQAVEAFTMSGPSRSCFVAGSMGPTTRTASLSPDVNNPAFRAITFDSLVVCYKQQAKVLIEAGADLLLLETFIDTLNAKAALFAVMTLFDELGRTLPIMVSGTVTDASGRLLSGQTVEAFLISISHAPLLSVGLNCALGAEQLRPHIEVLAKEAPFYVSTHPNAGLPNEFGGYDQTPEEIALCLEEFAQQGWLNIVGGCCGTTPDHIRAISQAVSKYPPRRVRSSRKDQYTKCILPIVNPSTVQVDQKWIGDSSSSFRKGQPTPRSNREPTYSLREITKVISQIDNPATLSELIDQFGQEKALYHPEQAMLINAHLWGRTQYLRLQE